MHQYPCSHSPNPSDQESRGFTIIEVLVAVSISAGVIGLLVPALLRQVAAGEQTNRLTAVEAVVSRDLNWFTNYARLWKLKVGSYSLPTASSTGYSDVTKTNYISGGANVYEPTVADCNSMGSSLLADAGSISTPTLMSPYSISNTKIDVNIGGGIAMKLNRIATPLGNKIRIYYELDSDNADGLTFTREASVLAEAAAWCDRLP